MVASGIFGKKRKSKGKVRKPKRGAPADDDDVSAAKTEEPATWLQVIFAVNSFLMYVIGPQSTVSVQHCCYRASILNILHLRS